jgi:N-acetylglucosamine malate deacetylase 1
MKRVLILGSHCDDIELGCGGTLHKHRNNWKTTCAVFMKHGDHIGLKNLYKSSEMALTTLGVQDVRHYDLPVNDHHKHRQEIWKKLHELEKEIQPDLVITQQPDEHQDHETMYKETIRNFRKSSVLSYRSSIRNCMNFEYHVFEPLSSDDVLAKQEALKIYDMYTDKVYFKPENIEAMLRVQGIYVEEEFAEIFGSIKIVGL